MHLADPYLEEREMSTPTTEEIRRMAGVGSEVETTTVTAIGWICDYLDALEAGGREFEGVVGIDLERIMRRLDANDARLNQLEDYADDPAVFGHALETKEPAPVEALPDAPTMPLDCRWEGPLWEWGRAWQSRAATLRTMLLADRRTIAKLHKIAERSANGRMIENQSETLKAEREKSARLDSALEYATMSVEMGAAKRRGLEAQLADVTAQLTVEREESAGRAQRVRELELAYRVAKYLDAGTEQALAAAREPESEEP